MKIKVIIGVALFIVALVLLLVVEANKDSSENSIPAATSPNPNDPAIKGLNIN